MKKPLFSAKAHPYLIGGTGLTGLLAVVSVILLLGTRVDASKPAGSELQQVTFKKIQKEEDFKVLVYPVKVEAVISTTIAADFDGFVTKIQKNLGSEVKKGNTILVVKNNDPGFTYAAVPIRAPFNGVVMQIFPNLMSKVSRGDKLVSIVDPRKIKMTAEIPDADLAYLKTRMNGFFSTDLTDMEKNSEISISSFSPTVDPKTNTAQAEILFLDKKNLPKIGAVGYARFQIPLGAKIKIPETSISYFEGNPIVRLIDDQGNVKKQNIEIEAQVGGDYVIKRGLNGGEKLIVRASKPLKDGEKVEATDVDARAE